jgi:DNA-binding MarR family transcriptional regulator
LRAARCGPALLLAQTLCSAAFHTQEVMAERLSTRRLRRVHIGLAGAQLEQAIRDAEKAGLIERRADNERLIILTAAGRAAAR